MKLIISLILFILWSPSDNEAIIKEIKYQYSAIKSALPQMKKDTIELQDMSSEGGEAIVYKDASGHIRLITTELFGEMGKVIEEYYFNNDSLIFVYSEYHKYNAPMYVDSFNPKKTNVSKDRFYFSHDKLIRWIGPKNKQVSQGGEYADKEKEILEFCDKLVKLARLKT